MANFMPEYSLLYPAVSSLSASGKSNGILFIIISEQIKNIINSYRQSYIFEESYYSGSIGEKLMSVCHRLSAYAIRDYLDHMTRREAVSLCGLSEECIVKALSGENRDEA